MILIFKLLSLILLFSLFTAPQSSHAASDFQSWLQSVRAEAQTKGISQQTIQTAFNNIQPIQRVVELDRKQPEGKLTFEQYRKRVINQARIDQGRRLYRQHRDLLNQVSSQYGVQPQYIVALWGIETSYGNNTGGFKVIPALATLAYDGRRSDFFRKELISALKIIDKGHISAANMKGSWAGAMGQNQFMPSSFHAYAVDGNGDGKRDIWTNLPDVFASTANYLAKSGWNGDERWGRAVKIPSGFSKSLASRDIKKSIAEWQSLGVRLPNGGHLPTASDLKASIILPDGLPSKNSEAVAYMVYGNYSVIMRWNRSIYFATSVGLLADAIAG